MGKFGIGIRNARGDKLINFARTKELFIANTIFNLRTERKITWELGRGRNEIDFFLVRKNQMKFVRSYRVINQFEFVSDHKMIRMCFKVKKILHHAKNNEKKEKIFFVNDINKIRQFNNNIENLTTNRINSYDQMIENIKTASEPFKTKLKKKPILSEKTRNKITERESLKRKRNVDITHDVEFKKVRKIANKMIKNDVYRHEVRELENAISNNNKWKHLKEILKMKDKNGILHHNTDEILEVTADFYENLYRSNLSEYKKKMITPDLTNNLPYEEFTLDDLERGIHSMKNGKSTGNDNVPIELLKVSDADFRQKILEIFNQILESEEIPSQWTFTKIILIHKKGDITDINNYRPISLVDHMYKLFMRMILFKIED